MLRLKPLGDPQHRTPTPNATLHPPPARQARRTHALANRVPRAQLTATAFRMMEPQSEAAVAGRTESFRAAVAVPEDDGAGAAVPQNSSREGRKDVRIPACLGARAALAFCARVLPWR